ncbi:uncharacterized protein L969DRAFT_484409 [Mixia osmundae IAM 14324]|uniref:uncharacterized protein n=1 Tax=Mixia osmundae (strain CBS 9802 / IAM 14324 / JCM 22182 / KY 12970) TaxID=764103 RepID=UPI0004A55506|nr:uncharacterized protein L969DRAFT_484409 [Mixia osmundae IAM 14324]KEI38777.1 hypothetical protein L969DRAFT_484409 [Mixia osmundae IAM 14324]
MMTSTLSRCLVATRRNAGVQTHAALSFAAMGSRSTACTYLRFSIRPPRVSISDDDFPGRLQCGHIDGSDHNQLASNGRQSYGDAARPDRWAMVARGATPNPNGEIKVIEASNNGIILFLAFFTRPYGRPFTELTSCCSVEMVYTLYINPTSLRVVELSQEHPTLYCGASEPKARAAPRCTPDRIGYAKPRTVCQGHWDLTTITPSTEVSQFVSIEGRGSAECKMTTLHPDINRVALLATNVSPMKTGIIVKLRLGSSPRWMPVLQPRGPDDKTVMTISSVGSYNDLVSVRITMPVEINPLSDAYAMFKRCCTGLDSITLTLDMGSKTARLKQESKDFALSCMSQEEATKSQQDDYQNACFLTDIGKPPRITPCTGQSSFTVVFSPADHANQ